MLVSLDVALLVAGVSIVSFTDSEECVRRGAISGGLFWVGGVAGADPGFLKRGGCKF